MAMPFGVGRMQSEAGSGMLKAEPSGYTPVCHNVSLCGMSGPAFGKESQCPTRIRGIFTIQLSKFTLIRPHLQALANPQNQG